MSARLFSPLTLGPWTLKNRICVPPMCQCKAVDGVAQPWHTMHYGKLASSGAGLLVIEATAVSPDGYVTRGDLGLFRDDQEAALKALVAHCHAVAPETKVVLQLSHAGRKGGQAIPWEASDTPHPDWRVVAPTDAPYDEGCAKPRALNHEDVLALIDAFTEASLRAKRAGFDGVQIHAAHGDLIHEFLSPITNTRTDAWGGTREKREAFLLEILSSIQKKMPDFPVLLRVSATDWMEGGATIDDAIHVVSQAKRCGVLGVGVTAGGIAPGQLKPEAKPGYLVPYAKAIKNATQMVTFAVGRITEPLQAEGILLQGDADGVSVGREMLRNPNWGWTAAQNLQALVAFPPPYLAAF